MFRLVQILEKKAGIDFDFLLVQWYSKERWGYINFKHPRLVVAFIQRQKAIHLHFKSLYFRFHGKTIEELSDGYIKSDKPLSVRIFRPRLEFERAFAGFLLEMAKHVFDLSAIRR